LVSDIRSYIRFILMFIFILGGFYMEWWYGKLVWVI
jgi:hypothetical protein